MALPIEHRREKIELFAQIGVRLVDDLTDKPPRGHIDLALDVDDAGVWRETDLAPVAISRGVFSWVSLERNADVSGAARLYRVRVSAEFYRPVYSIPGGEEFPVHPWNTDHPPAVFNKLQDIRLLPATNYAFPAHLPVIFGLVQDSSSAPVADAMVSQSNKSQVLSDERGAFAIPLRQAATGPPITIDAVKGTQTGTIDVTLPGDLGSNKLIPIA